MGSGYESPIDRQLREARERGEFDNLPGTGKPLPDAGRDYQEDWWITAWARREGAGASILPPTLQLRAISGPSGETTRTAAWSPISLKNSRSAWIEV